MVYSLLFTVYSLRLNKNNNNSWQRHKSFDFGSGSRTMVFICKHLRPYLLNLWTFLRQVMPLSGKNNKNSCVKFGGCEEEPTPAPPGGMGSWNDSVENLFLMFLLFESCDICWMCSAVGRKVMEACLQSDSW